MPEAVGLGDEFLWQGPDLGLELVEQLAEGTVIKLASDAGFYESLDVVGHGPDPGDQTLIDLDRLRRHAEKDRPASPPVVVRYSCANGSEFGIARRYLPDAKVMVEGQFCG